MQLANVQTFLGKPSHNVKRDNGGNYTQPPSSAAAQPQTVANEAGKIILDENGNAILT